MMNAVGFMSPICRSPTKPRVSLVNAVVAGQLARETQHERECVFGDSVRVGPLGDDHRDAELARRVEVHAIVAGAGLGNHLELLCGGEHAPREWGRAAQEARPPADARTALSAFPR